MSKQERKGKYLLGVHVSISGSIDLAVDRAVSLGCTTFQLFTRNPQGWKFSPLDKGVAETFREKLKSSGISVVVDHMPYLPNLSSPDEQTYNKSFDALKEELKRADMLSIPYVVLHLGSHMGKGVAFGQKRLATAVSSAYDELKPKAVMLLENMAGQKNSVGAGFEDIAKILEYTDKREVGICFDTCHAYAAGYDVTTSSGIEKTLEQFDRLIGLEKLKVVHLNDSKGPLGSGLDRHENIGRGFIGRNGFSMLLKREEINSHPMILETPVGNEEDYLRDLNTVRELLEA